MSGQVHRSESMRESPYDEHGVAKSNVQPIMLFDIIGDYRAGMIIYRFAPPKIDLVAVHDYKSINSHIRS